MEDNEHHLKSNNRFIHSKNIPTNYSSPSPPRPGFPQRVCTTYNQRSKSPIDLKNQFPFDDPMGILPYTTTSKLIPTTFISNNTYDSTHGIAQMIHEESEDTSYKDSIGVTCSNPEDTAHILKSMYDAAKIENSSIFQVTSPTEEHEPMKTFDYLYEFSETRKVLEEFFKCPESDKIKDLNESDDSLVSVHKY